MINNKKQLHPLETPIQFLKGVGPSRSDALATISISTVEELLYYPPRKYVDRTTVVPINKISINAPATIIARVTQTRYVKARRRYFMTTLEDSTGVITCVWFKGYQYLQNLIKKNDLLIISGKVSLYKKLQMTHPDFEILDTETENVPDYSSLHMGRIIPIYASNANLTRIQLTSKVMRKLSNAALEKYLDLTDEMIPASLLKKHNLLDIKTALHQLHFPEDMQQSKNARRRLSYNEFFFLQLILALRKQKLKNQLTKTPEPDKIPLLVDAFINGLAFKLTRAQQRVIKEIIHDIDTTHVMNRLLQGDVGSGKTIVAICAMLKTVAKGQQAALMVPTEVLAEQHFITISRLITLLKINVVLLLGGKQSKQKETLSALKTGKAQIIIGTHVLFQETVNFKSLGLIVIDEQHKFGVMQRTAFYQKGLSPHVLVMTATPIPRTLSLTAYGDLDISIIDELPAGHGNITTVSRSPKSRSKIYAFVKAEIAKGNQAYIVYPIIEESEKIDLESALKNYEMLKTDIFPKSSCGILHGRLKSAEKEKALMDFKNGNIKILVATTVIEVGLDVPQATIMLIEHAERFGLSQLHQLRGRVGRGLSTSYCILCPRSPLTLEARQRIKALTSTNDGFKIAEMDLEIRGPGEFLGTRQHGMPEFTIANILTDTKLLVQARQDAFSIIKQDPNFTLGKHICIKTHLQRKYKDKIDLLKIG